MFDSSASMGQGLASASGVPRVDLEILEARTLLSGTGASAAASRAKVSSITVLQASLPTAVTGANITFTASVKGAANGAPIASGKVNFEAEGPQNIVAGRRQSEQPEPGQRLDRPAHQARE